VKPEKLPLNTVLGYTPSISHWGWNGNTRRYWDNLWVLGWALSFRSEWMLWTDISFLFY